VGSCQRDALVRALQSWRHLERSTAGPAVIRAGTAAGRAWVGRTSVRRARIQASAFRIQRHIRILVGAEPPVRPRAAPAQPVNPATGTPPTWLSCTSATRLLGHTAVCPYPHSGSFINASGTPALPSSSTNVSVCDISRSQARRLMLLLLVPSS